MKRDWDLIRTILLNIENDVEDYEEFVRLSGFEGKSQKVLWDHVEMLIDAQFIKYTERLAAIYMPQLLKLTFQGHEFLDNMRNDTVWKKVLEKLKTAKDLSLPAIQAYAANIAAKLTFD